ncbi:MAG: hypothetical protein LWX52_03855 [Deltaproteobacteria bacterium]|jgi:hypothetical protein|nr:hypothetical protein [Deltaproteobacteria bacterium]
MKLGAGSTPAGRQDLGLSRYLSLNKNGELPQVNQFLKDEDQQALIEKAAKLLDCNIDFFRESKRLLGSNRDKRDAILYFLWKTGRCSNQMPKYDVL